MKSSLFRLVVLTCVIVLPAVAPADDDRTDEQQAVLVTGASSGIGLKVTEVLAANGYYVYAGARKPTDLARLDAIENVSSVQLDVTIQEEIDAAVEFVKSQGKGLHGIVNNAGVASFGPMTQVAEDEIDFLFGVNIYGVYRVTKAFAPLVIEQQGRITTIGSISGFLAGPNGGVYSMSKFAMEAFTDSLAAEMAPLGVKVSIVEPGSFKSSIWRTTAERSLARAEQSGRDVTEEMQQRAQGFIDYGEGQPEPDAVASAVLHALFAEAPKKRYMVTPDQRQAEVTIRTALGRVVQLNQDQQYSYDRDELVAMLDELLAAP